MMKFKKDLLKKMGETTSFAVVISMYVFGCTCIGAALYAGLVCIDTTGGAFIGTMFIIGFVSLLLGGFLDD